jgi:hypothetical protein
LIQVDALRRDLTHLFTALARLAAGVVFAVVCDHE